MELSLLDTSALSGYLREEDALHEAAVVEIEATLRAGFGLAVSAVSWAELLNGAKQGYHDETALREFADDFGLRVIAVDTEVAEVAASLQATYAKSARKKADQPRLRTPDALIIASAECHDDVERIITGEPKWLKLPSVETDIEVITE